LAHALNGAADKPPAPAHEALPAVRCNFPYPGGYSPTEETTWRVLSRSSIMALLAPKIRPVHSLVLRPTGH